MRLSSLVFWIALLWGLPAFAEVEEVRVNKNLLERIDSASSVTDWQIIHEKDARLVGPIKFGGSDYYANEIWLIRFDPASGVIHERIPMPAPITSLEANADGIQMEIEDGEKPFKMLYRPGQMAPQEAWNHKSISAHVRDARGLHPALAAKPGQKLSDEEHRAAIAAIESRQAQEPNSPFYPFFIAEQLLRLERSNEANDYFQKAVKLDGNHWTTDLQLTGLLDGVRQHDLADTVFERALVKIERQHPVVRSSLSVPYYLTILGVWSFTEVEAFVRDSEVDSVHRTMTRTLTLFPQIERSDVVSQSLATWFEEHGREDLAEIWWGRVERDSSWDLTYGAARRFDRVYVTGIGMGLALVWMAFLIGMRSRQPKSGARIWVPRAHGLDLLAIFLSILLSAWALWYSNVQVEILGYHTDFPFTMQHQSWGAAPVIEHLEGLAPTESQQGLMNHARQIRDSYASGEELVTPMAPMRDWRIVVGSNAWARAHHILYGIPGLFFFPILFLHLGWAVQRRFPSVQGWLSVMTPGSARSLRLVGPFVLGLFIASILHVATPLGELLSSDFYLTTLHHFGLGSLEPTYGTDRPFWMVVGVVSLVVHAATFRKDT
ncbi:hypothetical protein FRD01_22240 [Microvenator marinus]|uniref:Uncharacterized protein n=1 Tax=Microvenator marinus TaxID=2600177 RepID=A0A5B8XWT9_9DELT|nr:hypothetical protein [Microvenator marinus]QED29904.1 hypothetical protein FRD01_22240 [Microvenator marinus]